MKAITAAFAAVFILWVVDVNFNGPAIPTRSRE
jgi:hypothetical protein